MGYKIGIDVGGTFTDVVLIHGDEVIRMAKIPTQQRDLLHTLLSAIDEFELSILRSIDHITVSTTLITNAILQNHLPPVELILFPGSGMRLSALPWPIPFRILAGELDFRGREVQPPSPEEWKKLVSELSTQHPNVPVAIVSKFSHRNHIFEEQLAAYLKKEIPQIVMALGSEWGQSNFYRRSLTTYLHLASQKIFSTFSSQLTEALKTRGCNAPIRILKADGGVLPLENIRPVESIYSGPAASVLGALAQSPGQGSYIVVDIGGTTTDIGLVLTGNPMMGSQGAQIGPYLTHVRSLAVRSVAIGGDSTVLNVDGEIQLADHRLGPAYCMGGKHPTPTDAMRFLDLIDYGSYDKAEEAIAGLLPNSERNPAAMKEAAQYIVNKMADQIGSAIEQLVEEWKVEPAYKVWEVLHQQQDAIFSVQLSGGGGPGIAAALEKRMAAKTCITRFSSISNAVGAAMAKPTFSWTLNLDTSLSRYRIAETGEQGVWQGSRKPRKEVEQFLLDIAHKQAQTIGIETQTLLQEPFDYFPLVENNRTVGQIIRGAVHVPPGVSRLCTKEG